MAVPGQPLIQGHEVVDVQKALVKAGFSSLKVDGCFVNETHVAVKQFQQQKTLTADGDARGETLKALRLFL